MKPIGCTINDGETKIGYQLLIMNRKSLEIAVHPPSASSGGVSVVVKAPSNATLEVIEQKVRKRAPWIKRQVAYFNQFDPRTPERKYAGGESHLYLGRKYRLKIENSVQDRVLLKSGYFFVETPSEQPEHIKNLMDSWYKRRAQMILPGIFDGCWEDFKKSDLNKPVLRLRKMHKRWGSLSGKGRLTLNVKLIKAPKECIEYVVVHELCHLIHHHHGPGFYRLLDRTMPNWMGRKHKLEMALI